MNQNENVSCLHEVAAKGDQVLAALLLGHGADINIRSGSDVRIPLSSKCLSCIVISLFLCPFCLYIVLFHSPLPLIKLFLLACHTLFISLYFSLFLSLTLAVSLFSVFSVPQLGDTPLICASFLGQTEMVRFLIDRGADLDKGDNVSYPVITARSP